MPPNLVTPSSPVALFLANLLCPSLNQKCAPSLHTQAFAAVLGATCAGRPGRLQERAQQFARLQELAPRLLRGAGVWLLDGAAAAEGAPAAGLPLHPSAECIAEDRWVHSACFQAYCRALPPLSHQCPLVCACGCSAAAAAGVGQGRYGPLARSQRCPVGLLLPGSVTSCRRKVEWDGKTSLQEYVSDVNATVQASWESHGMSDAVSHWFVIMTPCAALCLLAARAAQRGVPVVGGGEGAGQGRQAVQGSCCLCCCP